MSCFRELLSKWDSSLTPMTTVSPTRWSAIKQCTIIWWVEDNCFLDMVISVIKGKFGKMKVTRGKEHAFFWVNLRFPGDGTVRILMKEYIEEAIAAFGEKLTRSAATPVTKMLFVLDSNAKLLSESKRERLSCTWQLKEISCYQIYFSNTTYSQWSWNRMVTNLVVKFLPHRCSVFLD